MNKNNRHASILVMLIAFIILLAMFLINIPSLYYGWYLKWDSFDTAQHFSGGLVMAMFMTAYLKKHLLTGEYIKNLLIITGATLFAGVVWEFAEYIANQTLIEPFYRWFGIRAYFMGDLDDTILDLLMDTLGAFTFFGLHSLRSRKPHQTQAQTKNILNGKA